MKKQIISCKQKWLKPLFVFMMLVLPLSSSIATVPAERIVSEEVGWTIHLHEGKSTSSILLDDGRVLFVGGYGDTWAETAEYYDPKKKQFFALPDMHSLRVHPFLEKLKDGRVLIISGVTYLPGRFGSNKRHVEFIETFDPKTNQFSDTVSVPEHLEIRRTQRLSNGDVFLLTLDAYYIFDHANNTIRFGGRLPRVFDNGLALLKTGEVLLLGGEDNFQKGHCNSVFKSYVIDTDKKTVKEVNYHRHDSGDFPSNKGFLFRLKDDSFLSIGGMLGTLLFSPDLQQIEDDISFHVPRNKDEMSYLLLEDSRILETGGDDFKTPKETVPSLLSYTLFVPEPKSKLEIYNPFDHRIQVIGSLHNYRSNPLMTTLQDGSVLVVGGNFIFNSGPTREHSTAEIIPKNVLETVP